MYIVHHSSSLKILSTFVKAKSVPALYIYLYIAQTYFQFKIICNFLTDIIDAVIAGGENPCRPMPPSELRELPALFALIQRCWAEVPQERPSFEDIVRQLRRFNMGRLVTILILNQTHPEWQVNSRVCSLQCSRVCMLGLKTSEMWSCRN